MTPSMSPENRSPNLDVGNDLAPVSVVAFNFALDSDNKIHDDEVAKKFGFRGGLVPGVADYDYMVRPVEAAVGERWLESGWAEARFLQPIYDGDTVSARARVSQSEGEALIFELSLLDGSGASCATGRAGLGSCAEGKGFELGFDPKDFPSADLPAPNARPPAGIAAIPAGSVLGSLEIDPRTPEFMADLAERYRRSELRNGLAPLPSSFYLDRANSILSSNVLLGPWIHVGSQIEHYSIPAAEEALQMRGRVHQSYERKGHEFAVLDLVVTSSERTVANIRHTAIIKPRTG